MVAQRNVEEKSDCSGQRIFASEFLGTSPPPDQNQVGERHHDKPHLMSKDRAPAAVVMYVVRMPKLMLTMLMPMLLLLPAACRG